MPRPQGTRWVFTLNNPTEQDRDNVAQLGNNRELVKYLVVGRERGASGTPHLQGFVIFKRTARFGRVGRLLPRSHIEPARGTSDQAAEYCKKDGDFDEYGEFPRAAGATGVLESLYAWGDEYIAEHGRAPTSPEVAREHPTAYLRYPRCVRLFQLRAPPPDLREGEPREWQSQLEQELEDEADDRSVIFYVDEEGGKGKSWFQQWYLTKYPMKAQLLSVGKRDDMALAVDETKSVFFLNVARGQMEYLQYSVLEMLKDRTVFSPKYNSRMKILRSKAHVIVFCNEYPDMNKMSIDRYVVRNQYDE